jgi:hypothetical protein
MNGTLRSVAHNSVRAVIFGYSYWRTRDCYDFLAYFYSSTHAKNISSFTACLLRKFFLSVADSAEYNFVTILLDVASHGTVLPGCFLWSFLRHILPEGLCTEVSYMTLHFAPMTNIKLYGLSPRTNYTDRATIACRQSDCQLLRIKGATWSAWRIPTTVFSVF